MDRLVYGQMDGQAVCGKSRPNGRQPTYGAASRALVQDDERLGHRHLTDTADTSRTHNRHIADKSQTNRSFVRRRSAVQLQLQLQAAGQAWQAGQAEKGLRRGPEGDGGQGEARLANPCLASVSE